MWWGWGLQTLKPFCTYGFTLQYSYTCTLVSRETHMERQSTNDALHHRSSSRVTHGTSRTARAWVGLYSLGPVCGRGDGRGLTPSCPPFCGTLRGWRAGRGSVASSCRPSWPCAPCGRAYGKTDQKPPRWRWRWRRRARGMEDERESGRMRGWKQSNTQGEEGRGEEEGKGNVAGDAFLYDCKMMMMSIFVDVLFFCVDVINHWLDSIVRARHQN